ncbi:hypothetical protein OG599_21410 [Streptomyces sp. NBC_01335]|uniref:hypothetical protein n=1 Tax=Streptomyces sp. NBC_01335 TaxID=2903828 RepID=UPI002E127449|nr:hypothetical protein OG599_21410 [Streptomyces sp. NBC_01335]
MSPGPSLPSQPAEVPAPVGGYRNVPVSAPIPDPTLPTAPGAAPGGAGLLAVDFEALAAAIEAARAAADAAHRAAADVSDAVRRSGAAPWGDDPGLGVGFGDAFAGPRDDLVRTVQELPAVLAGLADSLDGARRRFVRAEDEAGAVASGLTWSTDGEAG